MSEKPKFNPSDTFVLDNDTIDELDEISLTSVIRAFEVSSDEDTVKPGQEQRDEQQCDADSGNDDDGEFVLTLLDD